MSTLRRWVVGLAGYALAGGVVSLLGWVLDAPRLTDWIGSGISIQPNTTVAVICAATALLLLQGGYRRSCAALGGIAALLGCSALVELVSGINFGIDSLLMFGRSWGRTGVLSPGRMGPPAAISWTLIGTALVLASSGPRARRAVPVLALVSLMLAFLSGTGYLYGADVLYTLPRLTIIALQTSTFILAISAALILSVPERSPARRLLEDGVAGALIRRSVPAIVILPILLGFARLLGQRLQLYDLAFGTALRTVVEIVLLLGLLWWTAGTISRQARRAAARERVVKAIDHRLAGVLGSLSDPFIAFDNAWQITYVNDVGTRELGKPREELVGRVLWELFPEAMGHESYRHLTRAMADRVSIEYEAFFEAWQRWYFAKAYPTGDGGIALFFRDITEAKATGESLRASRHQLEVDLAAMTQLQTLSAQLAPADRRDPLLQQILVAAAQITGTDKGNIQIYDAQSGELTIVAHEGYGPRFLERFSARGAETVCATAAATKERVIVENVELDPRFDACEDDRRILLEDGIQAVQSTPLVSRDGRLLGVLNIQFRVRHRPADHELTYVDLLARMAADVVERCAAEQALVASERAERAARSEAERASAIKDEFLATLSHELRSPLNAIIGWVRILEKRPSDARLAEEAIQVIARNAKAQSELIADLLDMNRIISGKLRLEIGNVGLADVIRDSVETMRPAAEGKNIRLELMLSPAAGIIRGDAGRLQQVMSNLLSNAVKFTPKGGRIQVGLAKAESYAEVTVSDSGVGIDPRFLPHVFDRFRQEDASNAREHGGLGLGLAIVKQLVELHGGTIRAESKGEGHGSTFTVSLPLALMHVPTIDGRAVLVAPTPAEDVDLQGITVLAVEDQSDARELLRVVLERCHATVLTAGSVDEALQLLDSAHPDVILCDVGMPGKDGYDFIVELRRRKDQTPALAVTAFARTEDKVRALRAGFHAHVAKPIEPAELLSTVAVFARSGRE